MREAKPKFAETTIAWCAIVWDRSNSTPPSITAYVLLALHIPSLSKGTPFLHIELYITTHAILYNGGNQLDQNLHSRLQSHKENCRFSAIYTRNQKKHPPYWEKVQGEYQYKHTSLFFSSPFSCYEFIAKWKSQYIRTILLLVSGLLGSETRCWEVGEAFFSTSKNFALHSRIISANPFLIPWMVEEFSLWEWRGVAGDVQEQVMVRAIISELEGAQQGAPLWRRCENGSWTEASPIIVNKVLGIIGWPCARLSGVRLQCNHWLGICTTATRLRHSFGASHGTFELWNLEYTSANQLQVIEWCLHLCSIVFPSHSNIIPSLCEEKLRIRWRHGIVFFKSHPPWKTKFLHNDNWFSMCLKSLVSIL